MIRGGYLEDVLFYTSEAEDRMKSSTGVADFYYALKRFDAETFIHSEEVARLAVMLGKKSGFSDERLVNLAVSGYLHDVGKIFTGIKIIGKSDSLSVEEYDIVKEHPLVGYRHLKNFIDDEEILLGILQHHERIDGSGYISHLKEDEISEFGKIISVADVFSAMTHVRPYKDASSCNQALQYMTKSKGFDYELISILINMYIEGKVVECA